jgi:uncharacterized protein DUF11
MNVMLTNTLPGSVTFKSASSTQGTVGVSGNTLTGTLGTVAVSNSVTVTVTVVPQTVGTITNSAVVSSDYSDPSPADNSIVLTTTVLPLPFLSIAPYSANQVTISWPALLTNYLLQYKTNLAPSVTWSNSTTTPFISGTNRFIIETSSGSTKFYRLKD